MFSKPKFDSVIGDSSSLFKLSFATSQPVAWGRMLFKMCVAIHVISRVIGCLIKPGRTPQMAVMLDISSKNAITILFAC